MAGYQAQLSHGFRVSIKRNETGQPLLDEKRNYQFNFIYYVRAPQFRVVVFKGGGGRAWVYKKFLQIIEENGLIDYVKEYGGSSAGSLFAALAAMPLKRTERETIVDELDFHKDILDDSLSAKIYHVVMSPLYLISKPLEWIARGLDWAAGHINKIRIGKIIGYPLQFIAGLFHFGSVITHPLLLAGAYNLFSKGGIYRGRHLQAYICNSIYQGTITCLERFLNNEDKLHKRSKAILALSHLPDLIASIKKDPITKTYKVELATKDITFEHFHQLSKIKGLGFKDIFLTATRCKETTAGRLKIFNYQTDPKRTVHQAVRMSMSAPLIYQTVHDNGIEYMDGGCVDNFPILHASKRHYRNRFENTYFKGQQGQDLDVIGVTVEYEKDLGFIFNPIKILTGWWEKFTDGFEKFLYNKICGMDIYQPNDAVKDIVKEKYSQRVLELYDHGIGFTETDIAKPRGHRILQIEEKRINDFLQAHNLELTHLACYDSLSLEKQPDKKTMSLKTQKKFLQFLTKESIPDSSIFNCDLTELPLDDLRNQLIHTLKENMNGNKALNCHYTSSTNQIIRHIQPEEKEFEEKIRKSCVERSKKMNTPLMLWGIPHDTGGLGFNTDPGPGYVPELRVSL